MRKTKTTSRFARGHEKNKKMLYVLIMYMRKTKSTSRFNGVPEKTKKMI